MRLRIGLGVAIPLLVSCMAARARADDTRDSPSLAPPETPPSVYPRWTALEIQTPGVLAGSGGVWVLVPGGIHHRVGLATDLGLSLGGVTFALGLGVLRSEFEPVGRVTQHEKDWSVAVQGLIHRTWPWWTPRLPTSTTYVGTVISAGYVMYHGWLGAMRAVGDDENPDWKLIGGIGIGLP